MAFIRIKETAHPTDVVQLAAETGISNAVAAVLLNRGICTVEDCDRFFSSDAATHDPFEMLGMYEAVDLISEAVETGRRIVLYGDYDVDGVTSVCILYQYLTTLGANVTWYIPDRFREGYGLNRKAIADLASQGAEVLIALDCGITSVEEVALAKELLMDVLSVDHHLPPAELPEADVIVNPKQPYCDYPFKDLCTAGLATKLVEAHGGWNAAEQYIDLTAIGTVADLVPLLDENRTFVKKGLEKINQTPSIGVQALKILSGYGDKKVNARALAFGFAPRINAAGRLANAKDAASLLLSNNITEAYNFGKKLNAYNEERRSIEREIYKQAISDAQEREICQEKMLIVEGEGWNKGVIGIAASHFVEKFGRPCAVISCSEEMCTASARSVKGFNIYDALAQGRDLYTKFGGHSQAAGFSLKRENIPELKKRLADYAEQNLPENLLIPTLECECRLSPADIDMKMAKELVKLEPYGMGNESPLFFSDRFQFENISIIGKEKNVLKAAVSAGGKNIDCIGFGLQDYFDILSCPASKTAVFSVAVNVWQNVEKVQLQLEYVRLNIRTDKDIDGIVTSAREKLFESFSRDAVGGIAVPAQISPEEVIQKAAEHYTGSLILAAGSNTLRSMLQYIAKEGLEEHFTVYFGAIPAHHDFGANVILAMPSSEVAPGEFSQVYASQYINPDWLKDLGNTVVFADDDPFAEERAHDRIAFAAVYKKLQVLAPHMSGWTERGAFAQALSQGKETLSPFCMSLMLHVFAELNFIRLEETETMVRFVFSPTVTKRSLTDSKLFVEYSELCS